MKFSLPLKIAAIATVALTSIIPFESVKAAVSYGEEEVNQSEFIAIAAPYGQDKYNLLVLEQIPGKRDCWSESGSNPVEVDPLLLNFDFTGSCNRATDSNGYSLRVEGEDYGMDYLLSLAKRDGELVLVGTPRSDRTQPQIVIGRTHGLTDGFMKIQLEPGWRFTKRSYTDPATGKSKTLGHVYFSKGEPSVFTDIAGDIYRSEITDAVGLGFIAGFKEDNTFRPTEPLTREQLVSIVIGALDTLPDLNLTPPEGVTTQPYPDVLPSRWSAAKIEWAKENQIVTGYPDGSFRPEKPVTRAELMAVLRKAAEFARTEKGMSAELVATQTPTSFSDITGHWGQQLISEMSAYCNVASPLNETGDTFEPNTPASRNYAAAATLRTYNCLKDASGTGDRATKEVQ